MSWKIQSLTSQEGPKPGVGQNPTFGKGPENLSILFSKFEGPSLEFMEGLKPGPDPSKYLKHEPIPTHHYLPHLIYQKVSQTLNELGI